MGEILGIGVTHFPGLMLPDAYMSSFLTRTLKSDRVPAEMKEPARWPEPMRQELAANQNGAAAAEHRRRLVGGFRKAREALDAFEPDFVLIWGDDQYENFREDGVPSFCVFALDEIDSRPFGRPGRSELGNVWGEGPDKVVRVEGHRAAGSYLAAELIKADFDVSYAYAHAPRARPAACLHQHDPLSRLRPARLPLSGGAVPRELLRLLGHRQARRERASDRRRPIRTRSTRPAPTRRAASTSAAPSRACSPTARGAWRSLPRRAGRTRS